MWKEKGKTCFSFLTLEIKKYKKMTVFEKSMFLLKYNLLLLR